MIPVMWMAQVIDGRIGSSLSGEPKYAIPLTYTALSIAISVPKTTQSISKRLNGRWEGLREVVADSSVHIGRWFVIWQCWFLQGCNVIDSEGGGNNCLTSNIDATTESGSPVQS